MTTPRRPPARAWLGIATVAWAIVLVAAGVYSYRSGKVTVREQTTIVKALPAVDRALAAVLAGATGDTVVASVGGYDRVGSECDAGNRDGERYERVLHLYTQPGTEDELLARIKGALPKRYEPRLFRTSLSADAGYFVSLDGILVRPGELRFAAATGCRVRGGQIPGPDGGPGGAAATAADEFAQRAGVSATGGAAQRLGCGQPGGITTVVRTGPKPAKPLPGLVPPGATALVNGEDLVVYRAGAAGVSAGITGDQVRITATTGC